MRNRMKQIAILAGASVLAGCAWVQTPKEYAFSQGYRPIDIQGDKYFCRREQPEVPGSPLTGVDCLTRAQLSARVAQLNSARFRSDGLPLFDAFSFGFDAYSFGSPGAVALDSGSAAGNTFVNGRGLGR
jgi:hypothetical protein